MAASSGSSADTDDRTLTIARVFDAPRELVFKAWTDPAMIAKWMGPRAYPAFHAEADLRVGGKWRFGLRARDGGVDRWSTGVYREISAPERLVFTFAWEEEDGSRGPETVVTLTFATEGGRTRMIFHQNVFDTASNRNGHSEGWNSSFDRLNEFLRQQ